MRDKKTRIPALVVLCGMLVTLVLLALPFFQDTQEQITYRDFLQKVKDGEIQSVTMSEGAELKAVSTLGDHYLFANPRLETLKHALLLQGIEVREQSAGPFPYALLLGGLTAVLLFVRFRGRGREKEAAGKVLLDAESAIPSVNFSEVAANDEAMQSMRDLVDFIRDPLRYARYGARIPRGVLLYGPPGTGKTLMARALAGEAQVPFFAVNGADFVEMYVGVGASRIRKLFSKARKCGKAVIFIDEIDAIGKKRDNTSDEREQTLNALLSEMSGFHQQDGVIVLAATNRIDTLDEALLRAGRFDRQIEVPLPGYEERVRILKVHARSMPMDGDVSLEELAAQTALFSGARLEGMLNEAAILAAKRDAQTITQDDLNLAYETLLCGCEKRFPHILEQERRVTAVHEAGHALMTLLLLPDSQVKKVSIIPSTKGAAGYSMAIPPEKLFHHRTELLHHIAVALAGRAAEEISFGPGYVTTGASNDLEKAATLARRMVCEWGMLPEEGQLYTFSQSGRESASQQWLQRGYELAKSELYQHREAWNRMTTLLLQNEALSESEVRACLNLESA